MQVQESDFIRKFYQRVVPEKWRSRLYNAPLMQGIRESIRHDADDMPYVLLQERHIANLKTVLNRNALLSQLPEGAMAAEIGVNRGDFSERIFTYAKPRQLHLVDIWDSERYHEGLMHHVTTRFADRIEDSTVVIHRGYSTDMMKTFDDNFFDWVYIDTDHTYQTTAAELRLASKKVKPEGLILGHDYTTGDWKMRNRYGVVEAVNEFCVNYDYEFIYMTHETHRHCSYAIRKILD